jgi:hypothetical protein
MLLKTVSVLGARGLPVLPGLPGLPVLMALRDPKVLRVLME